MHDNSHVNGCEWDDDAPPPLSSLPDQLHAVQLADSIIGTAGLQEGDLRTAAVTDSAGTQQPSCLPPPAKVKPAGTRKPFMKGFLDAKPSSSSSSSSRTQSSSATAQPKSSSSSTQQHIPMLKAQQPQQPGSRAIPEGFMIPPDEQEKRLAAMKSQLLTALKPTPDTVSAVAQDSTLMSGFDDPEVMAAVAEVARDPKAFAKHAKNPKVQQFYMGMGKLMGSKLEKLGNPATVA